MQPMSVILFHLYRRVMYLEKQVKTVIVDDIPIIKAVMFICVTGNVLVTATIRLVQFN